MTLLLDAGALAARRPLVRGDGPLAPLAASLAADLDRAIAAEPHVPADKARLTRAGGTCPREGARLRFDPFREHAHACPACGAVYADEHHRRWWLMSYQLWLAERAVHAATLHALGGDPRHAAFAARVLDEVAERYPRYPNRDNVLGPSRPFFSTYLEALWLLHLAVALDLLEHADAVTGATSHAALGGRLRDVVLAPGAALLAGYREGRSNRQVWNAAASLALARLLDRPADAEREVYGADGLVAALGDGLLADGTWYEGENYHQFAHRGLWYGVHLAARAGLPLDDALLARYREGFAAPFRVALPDATLPSRRDSQYAVSLRQWRWAEWCELGLAAHDDVRLAAALARLYGSGAPAGDTGRWRASGEAERNEPACAVSRADLGWKSLLFARPVLPAAGEWAPGSLVLDDQGLAVLRGDGGRLWAGLDYGGGGGGHGHPDRLMLHLHDDGVRWSDDPGTGTYVERTLHWYRSTLAHAAPLVDGGRQPDTRGRLLGAALDGPVQGAAAAASIGAGARAVRTLLLGDGWLLDRLAWQADRAVTVDLPLLVDGTLDPDGSWTPLPGEEHVGTAPIVLDHPGERDAGFAFVEQAEASPLAGNPQRLALRAYATPERTASLWLLPPADALLWRARAPGPPAHPPRRFHAVRLRGEAGRLLCVWDLRAVLAGVTLDGDELRLARRDGGTETLRASRADGGGDEHPEGGWRITRVDVAGRVVHDVRLALHGESAARDLGESRHDPPRAPAELPPCEDLPADGRPLQFTLASAHYRRSEDSWDEAGRPTARVSLSLGGDVLRVSVSARLAHAPTFVPAGCENPLDNERADINGDGVQLLLMPAAHGSAGTAGPLTWLLVPEPPGPGVRVIPTSAAAGGVPLQATWAAEPGGWRIDCVVPRAAVAGPEREGIGIDVLVNEKPPGRERRRGQLVLGGAEGEFVYLRGDRHDATRALRILLPPAP